jgi:PAS domain S-box-containing protein
VDARDPSSTLDPASFAILVVDDEPTNVELLTRRLERKGYFTVGMTDPTKAIAKIEHTGFDLVILDLMMPVMSGLDVLRHVRQKFSASELPVIVASARSDSEAITECLDAQANDYVTKPLDFPVVLARVRTQLTMKAAVDLMRASEQRFRLLADLSQDLVSLHTPEGVFRFASPASRDLLGVEPDALVGVQLYDLLHPKDRAVMPPTPAELPDACTLTVRLKRHDDSWVWVEMKSRNLRGTRSGKVTDVQLTTRDISLYVDAWTGLPLSSRPGGATPIPAPISVGSSTGHPDVAPSIVVHQDRVAITEEPPPVRKKKPEGG